MRTDVEVKEAIEFFCNEERTKKTEAILDVLENNLDEEEIEEKYYNEDDIWTEQAALSTRQFLDCEIDIEELT